MFSELETKNTIDERIGLMHFDARTFRRVSFCPTLWLPVLVLVTLHGGGDAAAARGRGPARAQGRGSPGGWWRWWSSS